ncbi:SDR family oxidoreductase [Arenibacter amylolyticus]|uniref:SDR family oxidoreductase n=1 Tax=Arenibacter amylolyticus TaxID=1406873 RepID=UPI001C3CA6E5|nr:SDR family oxidoreductase [Arenibacter amylolyticus]
MNSTDKSLVVLVAGATGFLGSEICRQLIAANRKVKGLVRDTSDASKVTHLEKMGVITVKGDLKDRDSLDSALQGVNAVISTVSSTHSRKEGDTIKTVDEDGQINLIKAAADVSVERFIYVSFSEMPGQFPLQNAKRRVERQLENSGLNYTILQPTYFMEVWLSPLVGFDAANAKATIFGEGKKKISWISLKDVASFAVASLDNAAAHNKSILLGGPKALSPLEVVTIFEETKKKKFELQFVPEQALRAQKEGAQDPLAESIAALTLGVVSGSEIDMKTTLDKFKLQLCSVKEFATRGGGVKG